ncbi:MAG: hypothetical protein PHY48_03610 [Candidatus Cloacimonetes bacterium]|nr:hypothetical protein [Candidatus Cloacimonadota bacterium]
MGRAVLMLVMLMTVIFATILISLNRNIGGVPKVLIRNQLLKEAENASDYALRNAIRNAGSVEFLQTYLSDGFFVDELSFTQSYLNYRIGNCVIDSIRYSYVNSQANYKVRSFIRASLQGVSVSKDAEMSFNYPFLTLGSSKPNILYLEMERLTLFPWLFKNNTRLPDSSGNDYQADTAGNTILSDTVPWGGAFSRYCAKFDGRNDYITVLPQIDATGVDSINTDLSFSLLLFAMIDKNINKNNQGTLLWIPSEPLINNMIQKPCAGIWYAKSDNKLHFAVTQDNAAKDMLEVKVAYTPTAVVYNWVFFGLIQLFNVFFYEYPWCSYGLTYNAGLLKAYVNGVLVGVKQGEVNVRAYPSLHGMSMGRKDIRVSGFNNNDRMYFCGVLDQAGMHDRALMDTEMKSWHNGVMSATLIKYIRD